MYYRASNDVPEVGDVVQCAVDHYSSVRMGQTRVVQRIEDGCIILSNCLSPYSTSPFRPNNFYLLKRRKPEKENKVMIHIAVEIGDATIGNIVESINGGHITCGKSVIACDSVSALKERVRMDIERNPSHRWIICNGHTVGEHAAPPVRFRSL